MTQQRKWLKSTDMVSFDVRDQVAWITLNRPDKRNTLNAHLLKELNQAFIEADNLADVNVIVLQGEGRDFCAGYDLTGSYGGGKDEEEEVASATA